MSTPTFDGAATRVGPGSNPLGVALERLLGDLMRRGQGRDPARIAGFLASAGGVKTAIGGEVPAETDPPPSGGFVVPENPLLGRNVNTTG